MIHAKPAIDQPQTSLKELEIPFHLWCRLASARQRRRELLETNLLEPSPRARRAPYSKYSFSIVFFGII